MVDPSPAQPGHRVRPRGVRILRLGAALAALALLGAACGSTAEEQQDVGPGQGEAAEAGDADRTNPAPTEAAPNTAREPGEGDDRSPDQSGPDDQAQDGTGDGGTTGTGSDTTTGDGGTTETGSDTTTGDGGTTDTGSDTTTGDGSRDAGSAAEPGEEIPVGVIVGEGFDNVNDQLGGDFGGFGDGRRQAQAVIDEINGRGGLLGRTIVPVFAVRDDNSGVAYSEQEQAICSRWTEDHDVFAAVAVVNIYENLLACLNNAGKPFVAQHLYPYDQRIFDAYPQTFTPAMLGLDEMAQVYVDRLHAQGFFEEGRVPGQPVTVGLVRYDFPHYERVANEVLKPALAAHGIELEAEFAVRPDQSAQEHGNTAVQAQNGVLQFKAADVTHVLLLDRGAYLAVFWMQAAENQAYHPRYGLTSYDGPGILLQDAAPNQVQGALGIGWEPLVDVPIEDQPPENDTAARCKQLMEEAGQDMSSALTRLVAYQYCDTLWFLEQAVNRGGQLGLQPFVSGANATGTSYESPITFATRFGPDRHYGAAAVRDLAHSADCRCFQYTSDPHPLR